MPQKPSPSPPPADPTLGARALKWVGRAALWGVGLALAGVLPDVGLASELGGVRLLTGDLVSDARSLIPVGGFLPVAPMPPAPDSARLRQFSPPDAATESRWRALLTAAQAFI